jgi:PiT family inorganic phosphate transporter
MSDVAFQPGALGRADAPRKPDLEKKHHPMAAVLFFGALVVGLLFVTYSIYSDVQATGIQTTSYLPYLLLLVALLIALGFEFVNGFHDTANAVATVIYTHSLPPQFAVVWSGFFNFLGVLVSSGAVAFGIVSLLPVELILQVGSDAGFAMVFALLIAAIIWNLGTWSLGLPASSSHTLIGSIIGVGLANQLMATGGDSTSGVDWAQAANIGKSLLILPLVGFGCSAILLLLVKALVRNPTLYEAPKGDSAPPWWIRGILILTCTGVSFAHGSNDGQKGMGLIMLILIGTVPTAYALNRALPDSEVQTFQAVTQQVTGTLAKYTGGATVPDERAAVSEYIKHHELTPEALAGVSRLTQDIQDQVGPAGSIAKVPTGTIQNVRNDMYMTSEAIRILGKTENAAIAIEKNDMDVLKNYKGKLDAATKFIPTWVKIAVAIALGLGTMVGWKRIVVTVGEKIGKSHLTYAQGASAELVAAITIGAADMYGLPVSTTHVLSSGVAGTMAANGSGLQWGTIRNLLMAWVLTLPCAILLSGTLFFIFRHVF